MSTIDSRHERLARSVEVLPSKIITPQDRLKENKYDLKLFLPSKGMNESRRGNDGKAVAEERRETAKVEQRDRLIEKTTKDKKAVEGLSAGTSIAVTMTGDHHLMLHAAKERERERLRQQVVQTFHRNDKENKAPSGLTLQRTSQRNGPNALSSALTSLPVGYGQDRFQYVSSLQKHQLAQTLREQIKQKEERQ